MKKNTPKNHHYVPKLLLKNFSHQRENSNESYIHAFDKHNETTFTPNISKIVSETKFYDFGDEENSSLEPLLAEMETYTAPAIQKIIATENLHEVPHEDMLWLCHFVATQYVRVKKHRENIQQINNLMLDHIRKRGYSPDQVKDFEILTDKKVKEISLSHLSSLVPRIALGLSEKNILLFKAPSDKNLYISDNPVVLHNTHNKSSYGNLGFDSSGIEIYLPISSKLCVAFWCPQIHMISAEELRQQKELESKINHALLFEKLRDKTALIHTRKEIALSVKKLEAFHENAHSGTPILMDEKNVEHLNHLQVGWSYRYVLSANNDFSLARRMLQDNPDIKDGWKLTTN